MPTFYRSEHNESENVEWKGDTTRSSFGRRQRKTHNTKRERKEHLLLMDLEAVNATYVFSGPLCDCSAEEWGEDG